MQSGDSQSSSVLEVQPVLVQDVLDKRIPPEREHVVTQRNDSVARVVGVVPDVRVI
jgi:hypothetical protein